VVHMAGSRAGTPSTAQTYCGVFHSMAWLLLRPGTHPYRVDREPQQEWPPAYSPELESS
jgi:hypothetical protein